MGPCAWSGPAPGTPRRWRASAKQCAAAVRPAPTVMGSPRHPQSPGCCPLPRCRHSGTGWGPAPSPCPRSWTQIAGDPWDRVWHLRQAPSAPHPQHLWHRDTPRPPLPEVRGSHPRLTPRSCAGVFPAGRRPPSRPMSESTQFQCRVLCHSSSRGQRHIDEGAVPCDHAVRRFRLPCVITGDHISPGEVILSSWLGPAPWRRDGHPAPRSHALPCQYSHTYSRPRTPRVSLLSQLQGNARSAALPPRRRPPLGLPLPGRVRQRPHDAGRDHRHVHDRLHARGQPGVEARTSDSVSAVGPGDTAARLCRGVGRRATDGTPAPRPTQSTTARAFARCAASQPPHLAADGGLDEVEQGVQQAQRRRDRQALVRAIPFQRPRHQRLGRQWSVVHKHLRARHVGAQPICSVVSVVPAPACLLASSRPRHSHGALEHPPPPPANPPLRPTLLCRKSSVAGRPAAANLRPSPSCSETFACMPGGKWRGDRSCSSQAPRSPPLPANSAPRARCSSALFSPRYRPPGGSAMPDHMRAAGVACIWASPGTLPLHAPLSQTSPKKMCCSRAAPAAEVKSSRIAASVLAPVCR